MARALDEAGARVWNECHCRLRVCRTDLAFAGSPAHQRRVELAGTCLPPYICASSRSDECVFALCADLRADVLGGDVCALSQRHFPEALTVVFSSPSCHPEQSERSRFFAGETQI